MSARVRRLLLTVVIVVASAVVLPFAGTANAQSTPPIPPSGGITLSPATGGTDITLLNGTTTGPCDVPGSNGLQVFVTGPGPFAPNEPAGRQDGIAIVAATSGDGGNTVYSKTGPNKFEARGGFLDFAREVGLTEVPVGDYIVDFRCVDVDFTTPFQTYRSTLTFTTPTSFTATGSPVSTPNPSGSPTPTPAVTPSPSGSPTPNPSATPTPDGTPTPAPTPADGTPTPTPADGTPTPTPTPASGGAGGTGSGGALAFTGAPITTLAAGGGVLVAAGVALLLVGRRRRTER